MGKSIEEQRKLIRTLKKRNNELVTVVKFIKKVKKVKPKKKNAKKVKRPINDFKAKYKDYLLSNEWIAIKIDIYQKRGRQCEQCGNKTKLQIHHLTYDNIFNEEPSDLLILCESCHKEKHINK